VTGTADIHESIESLLAAEPTLEETVQRMIEHPMRFVGRRHRDDHVRKHVIEARHERWHQIVDADLLTRVRTGNDAEVAFEHLARVYVRLLDEVVDLVTRPPIGEARRLARLVRFEVLPPTEPGKVIGGFRADQRSLVVWCPVRRLRIVAGIPVSNPEATSYRLLSGYRSDLEGSARRFDRTVLGRLADRVERSQERLLDPLPDAAELPSAPDAHG
jgi:hypothetical protein